jgi:DnaJ domain
MLKTTRLYQERIQQMSTELDQYQVEYEPMSRQWLDNPLFCKIATEHGFLERFQAQYILDKQQLNTPDSREWIEETTRKYREEQKQSADYQLLGLSNHEGHLLKKHVRNAYRRQSRHLHPDAGGNDEAFKELHAAYRRVLASVPKE